MTDPTPPDTKMDCEARARELLAAEVCNQALASSLRANARGCASGTVFTSSALRAISTALSEVERLRSALERIAGGQRVHVDGPGQMRFEEYTPREWASQALEGRG